MHSLAWPLHLQKAYFKKTFKTNCWVLLTSDMIDIFHVLFIQISALMKYLELVNQL